MFKGALALVNVYSGDSSDEEVPTGRISIKRSSTEPQFLTKRLRTSLPIPELIKKTLNENENENIHIDDPMQHDGRIRSFPHERGNWVTYIFIPYEPDDMIMTDIITYIANKLHDFNLRPINNYHISLTKTVVLKHHWIESFMQSVREKLSIIKKFLVLFHTLNVYCNEEKTRTFIGIEIKSGYDTLVKLVKLLDESLAEFRLPQFYENPSFHMSLLWCNGDYQQQIENALPQLQSEVNKILLNYPQNSWYNFVQRLECKCGNKLFTFSLN